MIKLADETNLFLKALNFTLKLKFWVTNNDTFSQNATKNAEQPQKFNFQIAFRKHVQVDLPLFDKILSATFYYIFLLLQTKYILRD